MDNSGHPRPYLIARHHCIFIQLVPHESTLSWQIDLFLRVSMETATSKDHESTTVRSYFQLLPAPLKKLISY